jgi:hypothetical protein
MLYNITQATMHANARIPGFAVVSDNDSKIHGRAAAASLSDRSTTRRRRAAVAAMTVFPSAFMLAVAAGDLQRLAIALTT